MELSADQKRRIEENRMKALQLRAQRSLAGKNSNSCQQVNSDAKNKNTSQVQATNILTKNVSGVSFAKVQHGQPSISSSASSNNSINKIISPVSPSPLTTFAEKVKAKCILISRDRFQVTIPYFGPLIELFKTAKTRSYDIQTKQWSFSISDYEFIKKEISTKMNTVVDFEGLPKIVLTVLKTGGKAEHNSLDLSKVDSKLHLALLPFQKEGVEFCIKNKGRLLIADDMGLGKTLQAICLASYYREEWPLLVITPSSVKFTWLQQLLTWLPSLTKQQVNVIVKKTNDCSVGDVVVISYDLLSGNLQKILRRNFKVVIADESHLLKNNNTVRTQSARPILTKATRVIMLSGTPALSRPVELFSQLSCLDSKTFNNFHEYGVRYCNARKLPWGWDYSGSSNLTELKILLQDKYLIRRMKQDVLPQLPSKYRTMVVLDPTSIKVNKDMKQSHAVVEKTKERKCLLEYFHKTGEAKVKAVCDYVLDLLETGKKFLVFAHHQLMMDSLEQLVKSKCYEYIRIDGRTTAEQRDFFCEKFQTSGDRVRIAILSIVAANAGINLSAANLVIFAELFWNPGIMVQAEDRAHRIGQLDSVNIQYLVARNTCDDFIWAMVQNKMELLSQAGISGHTFKEADTKIMEDNSQSLVTSYFDNKTADDDLFGDLDDDDLLSVEVDYNSIDHDAASNHDMEDIEFYEELLAEEIQVTYDDDEADSDSGRNINKRKQIDDSSENDTFKVKRHKIPQH